VRRVITLGTPHRGSRIANDATRWLGRKLITLPSQFIARQQKVLRDNRDVFRPGSILEVTTSIDSLSPDSPILPVMLTSPRAPWVHYHNIVGVIEEDHWLSSWSEEGDGVVALASAHLGDAESELAVSADHTSVHRHPLAILEVRRILLEHLAEVRRAGAPMLPLQRTAGTRGYVAPASAGSARQTR
jgi:hypothetical protein